jgi:hypothetical protein
VAARMSAVLDELIAEFGIRSRIAAPLVGRYVLARVRAEEARIARGATFEPPTFYEKNLSARADLPATHSIALGSIAPRPMEVALPAAARIGM